MAIKAFFSYALKYSWLALIFSGGFLAIPTLFYINFHVLMAYLVRSPAFCKLGQEWKISEITGGAFPLENLTGMGEGILLAIADTLTIFAIGIIGVIIYILVNPCEVVTVGTQTFLGWEWVAHLLGGICKAGAFIIP